jgi:hypothetical protein
MRKMIGSSRSLIERYLKFVYEEPNKNDQNNESSILNKKSSNSWVYNIFILL